MRFLLVHHTTGSNTYRSADVVGLLRSYHALHTGPTKRWPDLAYNFMIDRFGTVWEGRAGSIERPVIGDATGGNQGFSQLVCLIGEFQTVAPSSAAASSLVSVLGWLGGRYGIDLRRGAKTTFVSRGSNLYPKGTSVTTATIAGHRQMSRTACPGDAGMRLVASLPDRVRAASPIAAKYSALGGSAGFLGAAVGVEKAIADKRGRIARYENGTIYWASSTGAHEVHGDILTEFGRSGSVHGILKYPTSDTLSSSDQRARYSNFENGRIYHRSSGGTFTVPKPHFTKHEAVGGVHGVLGYPTSAVLVSSDQASRYQNFERGRIYVQGTRAVEIHGAVFAKHEAVGGVHGALGYPIDDLNPAGDNRGKGQWFEHGFIWYSVATGAHALWGKVNDRFLANGHVKGYLRYPTSEPTAVGDGRGTCATFERGHIYASDTTGGHEVHGAVLDAYLDSHGGPGGPLGYPTSELDPAGTPGGRYQRFQHGSLRYINESSVVLDS